LVLPIQIHLSGTSGRLILTKNNNFAYQAVPTLAPKYQQNFENTDFYCIGLLV
jgi:hypothetical protein